MQSPALVRVSVNDRHSEVQARELSATPCDSMSVFNVSIGVMPISLARAIACRNIQVVVSRIARMACVSLRQSSTRLATGVAETPLQRIAGLK